MSVFTSCAGTYSNACDLIEALKLQGIRSNITTGGVDIHCTPEQINIAREICKRYSASFDAGFTRFEKELLLETGEAALIKQVTGDSVSLIKEWEK